MECYGKIAEKHGVRIRKSKLQKNMYTLIPFIYDRKISMHVDVQIKTPSQTIPVIISWEEMSTRRLRFPYFVYVILFCILFGVVFMKNMYYVYYVKVDNENYYFGENLGQGN